MRIWIDLTNSPHINFFKPFINKWKSDGHKIIITARKLANTIGLIEQNKWKYKIIGGHAGKSKYKKLLYFPVRVFQLVKYLRSCEIDVGVSHSSFYSPIVCKLLGIPSVYLNDNEHAKGNYLAFKYATLNILPEFLKEEASELNWTERYNISFYPGIKEGVYLSKMSYTDGTNTRKNKAIYIRLEPWTAEYYSGRSHFIDKLLIELRENYRVVILPRGSEQLEYYTSKKFSDIRVVSKPLPLEEIHQDCKLFIGAGGSMTREMAFLGKPTLSIYQDELLEVDKYLIENKFMYHTRTPTMVIIEYLLNRVASNKNKKLKNKGAKAFTFIEKNIRNVALP